MTRVRLHHTHLFAADLGASLDFYTRWFGAEVVADQTYHGARNVMIDVGGGRLNFYDQAPRDRGRNAIHHLGMQVEGLAALVGQMAAGGVEFRTPIRTGSELDYIMVEAPDGVLLELFEVHGDAPQTPGEQAWFGW